MRIGLDLHTLGDLMQGSRTYMANLARMLPVMAPDLEFVYYVPDVDAPEARALAEPPNVSLSPVPAGRFARLVWPFPRRLAREVDVFHCQYVMPLTPTVPCVSTIHDVLHETMPRHYPGVLGRLMRLLYPWGARRAAKVLTVSRFSMEEIVARYGVRPERVAYAHNGVSPDFAPVTDPARLAAVRARYGLPERYILFLGRIEPRKNLPGLTAAYRLLRARTADPPRLVIAGGRDVLFSAFHDRLSREHGTDGIVFAGSVDQADLPALYSGAAVFAYPSFGEGFGLPVVEAMACGAPVTTSTTPAIPEVAGGAALLVDPEDAEGLAEALRRVLDDDALARDLRARGLARAAAFSWEPAARLALAAYAEAAASRPSAGS